MRYKLLGKSGLKVSELCLGAMTFGDNWGWGSTKTVKEEKRLEHPMVAPLMHITERKRRIAAALVEVAEAIGKTPAQVALTWLRQQPGVMIPIFGAPAIPAKRQYGLCGSCSRRRVPATVE